VHEDEGCGFFSSADIVRRLSSITFPRTLLLAMFGGLLFLLLTGMLGGPAWDWIRSGSPSPSGALRS